MTRKKVASAPSRLRRWRARREKEVKARNFVARRCAHIKAPESMTP
jgi:hypothetical protein